jgi:imidazolonepropionase-like amidohydrolase
MKTVLAIMTTMLGVAFQVRVATGDEPAVLVIKAARIHVVAGDPIDNGVIVIRAGKIEALGPAVSVPDGARIIELADAVVTPGLIDACCTVDAAIPLTAWSSAMTGQPENIWTRIAREEFRRERDQADPLGAPDVAPTSSDSAPPPAAAGVAPFVYGSEQSAEVTPHRLTIDGVNLLSKDFERLLKAGVTTVYVSPDSVNVIGERGAIVKTGGPLAERIVRRADAVKVSLGSDPARRGDGNGGPYGGPPTFHIRRPETRMGVDWVFRKAFYDADRVRRGLEISGAETPPLAAVPVLQQVREGQIPVRMQARLQNDIFTALRLAREFNLKFILEEGTEAYRCLPELKAAGVPVIFGPLYMTPTGFRAYSGETWRPRLNTPKQLAEAGISFALTAQELRDEDGLVRQGMVAIQNGLSPAQALRALTSVPAGLLGLAGVGELKPGAAADLVVWSGEPFAPTSRPRVVVIGGRVAYESEPDAHATGPSKTDAQARGATP